MKMREEKHSLNAIQDREFILEDQHFYGSNLFEKVGNCVQIFPSDTRCISLLHTSLFISKMLVALNLRVVLKDRLAALFPHLRWTLRHWRPN